MAPTWRHPHHEAMMNETMTTPQRQPEFVRPRDDRVIAGVCAGLARRLNIGVGWIRVAFVILSFFGGLGILLYAIGWVVMPSEGATTSIAEGWLGDLEGSTQWIGVGLMVVAGLVLLSATGLVSPELVLAAGLFVAGVLLYRTRSGGEGSSQAPGVTDRTEAVVETAVVAEPVGAAAMIETTSVEIPPTQDHDAAPTIPAATSPQPSAPQAVAPAPPPPRRPPSYLGRLTVASALIVVGLMGLLDNLDVISPGFRHYVGAAVLVIGLGLLVGSVIGRARGLIALGLVLTPVLLFAAAIKVPLFGEYGDDAYRPASVAEIEPVYELSGGRLAVDLRDVAIWSPPAVVRADLGIGELVIFVPRDLDVAVNADVGIGAITLFGQETGGLGLDRTTVYEGGDGVIDVEIDASLGIGSLEVVGVE